MAGIHPLSRTQQFDKNTAKFLNGGKLYLYAAGSSTPIDAYQDYGLASKHPWPITLDSAGRVPMIYLSEADFKHRLTDSSGVLQFQDDSIPTTGPSGGGGGGGGGTSVDPTSTFGTRDIKIRFDDQPLTGYVRLNGRTIGSATSGATERANSDTQSLFEELWSYTNISVTGGKGATAASDWLANKTLILPDVAGRVLGAVTDMGDGIKTTVTSATVANANTVGATGGSETHTLSVSQTPSHNHSGTTDGNDNHEHLVAKVTGANGGVDALSSSNTITTTGYTGSDQASYYALRGTTATPDVGKTLKTGSTAQTFTTSSVGGGAAHNNVQPTAFFMVYIKL